MGKLIYNGTTIKKINFNGSRVKKVMYNGTNVFNEGNDFVMTIPTTPQMYWNGWINGSFPITVNCADDVITLDYESGTKCSDRGGNGYDISVSVYETINQPTITGDDILDFTLVLRISTSYTYYDQYNDRWGTFATKDVDVTVTYKDGEITYSPTSRQTLGADGGPTYPGYYMYEYLNITGVSVISYTRND